MDISAIGRRSIGDPSDVYLFGRSVVRSSTVGRSFGRPAIDRMTVGRSVVRHSVNLSFGQPEHIGRRSGDRSIGWGYVGRLIDQLVSRSSGRFGVRSVHRSVGVWLIGDRSVTK